MPKYQYEIQTAGGKLSTGTLDASSLMEASTRARQQGGQLRHISPVSKANAQDVLKQLRDIRVDFGPGLKDVLGFTKQLAVMMKAGISIRDAIEGISEQMDNPKMKKALDQVRSDVEAGQPLSSALSKHPKIFDRLYVDMVRASEMSGTFSHMLERIAKYKTQQAETRSMVRGAMIYPIILFVMSIAASTFLLTWVMPRFMGIFKGKEQFLPAPTKMLLAMSDFMTNQWYIIVGVVAVLVTLFVLALRTDFGRYHFDQFKLKVPLLNRMFRAVYITRGLQTMGELINAGVPMLDTLQITADVSGNKLYANLWMRTRSAVQEGNKIVAPLVRDELLPRPVVQMIAAGEESGKLGEVLADVSEFYARELRDTIKATTAMIEPLMIVIMGVIVGFIAMSIILPVFKMSSLMTQG